MKRDALFFCFVLFVADIASAVPRARYLGPANRLSAIDFMGVTGPLLPPQTPSIFLAVTAALALFAVVGRQRQLTR